MKGRNRPCPPRLARWCARVMVPPPNRSFVLDDLLEEWTRRVELHGDRAADWWYWRQVLQSIGPSISLRREARRSRWDGRRRGRFEFDGVATVVRHAGRRLRRTPGFTVAVGLTLAIGIAANVAVFSLVDGVLLRPLPYPASDRVVVLRHNASAFGLAETGISGGLHLHYREHNRVFTDLAMWQTASVNLTAEAEPERVDLVLATTSLFPLLGVRPIVGPGFGADAVGGTSVLLSFGLWQRRYAGDPSVVGRTIEVNGVQRIVAGVMPADFRFPHPRIDLWMDLPDGGEDRSIGGFYYEGAARLRDGVTVEEATADLRRLAARLELPATAGATPPSLVPLVSPLRDYVVRDVRLTLWLLFGAMAFVLFIVCANVANLHLVRAASREREVVVRAALGANRRQLIRPFLAESVLLGAIGGLSGLLLGAFAVRLLVAMPVVGLPRLEEVSIDGRVILFAAVLSLGTGVLLGVVPATRVVRSGVARGLRSAGRAFTASRERRRAQHILVIAQVAISLTLLIGSALMVQTLWRLRTSDPGFDARDLLTFEVILPYRGYETYETSARFQLELLDRIRGLPEVEAAGAVGGLPMATSEFSERAVSLEVFGAALPAEDRQVRYRVVTDGFFETMRIPIVAGRTPVRTDRTQDGAPVLISANLAARLFPNESAIGKRVRRERSQRTFELGPWNTIIGIVADVRYDGIAQPAPEIVYVPVLDAAVSPGLTAGFLAFAVRTSAPLLTLVPSVRAIVDELDPALPIASVQGMQDILDAATARTAFTTWLLVIATAAALFLGVIGIYGVLSYTVGLRRREMGLRLALGARAQEVLRLVLRDGLIVTSVGLLLGVSAAIAFTRFLRSLLHGVSPTDPLTYAAAVALLFVVAFSACTLPARRAARVEPIEALAIED